MKLNSTLDRLNTLKCFQHFRNDFKTRLLGLEYFEPLDSLDRLFFDTSSLSISLADLYLFLLLLLFPDYHNERIQISCPGPALRRRHPCRRDRRIQTGSRGKYLSILVHFCTIVHIGIVYKVALA